MQPRSDGPGVLPKVDPERTCADAGVCKRVHVDYWRGLLALVDRVHSVSKQMPIPMLCECRSIWLLSGRSADGATTMARAAMVAHRQLKPYRIVFLDLQLAGGGDLLIWANAKHFP
eukprot:9495999-Pyramimonas_sp.AAC.1